MSNDYGGSPTVINCVFRANSGIDGGGGMRNWDGSNPTVANCTFSGNSGGMLNDGGYPTVTNCTFSGNSGVGVFSRVGDLTMTNCIVWSNSGSEIYIMSGSATVAYCDVEGGWPGTGNIDADPVFVDAAGGDFHLSPSSPCLDAGDNGAVPSWLTTDLDGNPRIQGAAVDMGVYEFARQAVIEDFYLHGADSDLTLDHAAPAGTTARYKDSPSLRRTAFQEIGAWRYEAASAMHLLSGSLQGLRIWIGLKNSDDQGTYFDIRGELLKNGTTIGSGETLNIQGVTRNPDKAKEVVVAFGDISDGEFNPGDVLSLRILTKVTDQGGHNSAVGLRLYYDSANRPSKIEGNSAP